MNVLILFDDQNRWDALGCAADGSALARASWLASATVDGKPLIQTPHLDRLARESVRFRNAVANLPVCSPCRQSMITGLMPSQLGAITNDHYYADQLPAPTLGHYFQQAGYDTACFGKMHWKSSKSPQEHVPDTRGFATRVSYAYRRTEDPADRTYHEHVGLEVAQQTDSERRGPTGVSEGPTSYIGGASAFPADQLVEAWMTDQAIAHLKSLKADDRFCMMLSLDRPHPASFVPREFIDRYDPAKMPLPPAMPEGWAEPDEHLAKLNEHRGYGQMTDDDRRTAVARYLANVSYVDACFGRILDALDETGRADDTLVIFLSDHGDLLGERDSYTKYNLYESSLRVPLLVRLPGGRAAGSACDAPVELVDLLPTCLEAAGLETPKHLAGRSLMPLLQGRAAAEVGWRNATFTEFYYGQGARWVARGPRYKLIEHPGGRPLLFDLQADPQEAHNLIDEPGLAEQRSLLRQQLLHRAMQQSQAYPANDPGQVTCLSGAKKKARPVSMPASR